MWRIPSAVWLRFMMRGPLLWCSLCIGFLGAGVLYSLVCGICHDIHGV